MTDSLIIGCGTCPKGHNDGVAFVNNTIPGWRCENCNAGALTPKSPAKCPKCGGGIEKRVLRTPNICGCAQCHTFYPMTLGTFEVPRPEELEELWPR
jgi:hypothetical protein